MDKQHLKNIRLIDHIKENIIGKSNVKNKALAIEIARKWVKRA